MYARRKNARRNLTFRSMLALGLALGTGPINPLRADFPVLVQSSYAVVPASVTVVAPSVTLPATYVLAPTTSYVLAPTISYPLAPTTYVQYESVPLGFLPTVSWLPGPPIVESAEWMTLDASCVCPVIETPLAGPVIETPAAGKAQVTPPPIQSTPQSGAVAELPGEAPTKPSGNGKEQDEPGLTHGTDSPPASPEAQTKPAEKPRASAEKSSQLPKPPGPAPAEKSSAPTNGIDVPFNQSTKSPINPTSSENKPAALPPAAPGRDQPRPGSLQGSPAGEAPKSSRLSELAPAAPAEETKPGSLTAPGQPVIPIPGELPPELALPPGGDRPSGKPESKPNRKDTPAIPPPVNDILPPSVPAGDQAKPVEPLTDNSKSSQLQPVRPAEETELAPIDSQTRKAGAEKAAEPAKPPGDSSPVKRDTLKPNLASLDILVRSARSSSPESGVQVRFRESASGQQAEAVTDSAGRARIDLSEGTWEVEAPSASGRRYVLGELVSKSGRATTKSGRDLPRLEIDR